MIYLISPKLHPARRYLIEAHSPEEAAAKIGYPLEQCRVKDQSRFAWPKKVESGKSKVKSEDPGAVSALSTRHFALSTPEDAA